MADGKVVIDIMLDDGSVAKGVADLDGKLSGLQSSGEKGAMGIGQIVAALGLVALGAKAIGLVKDSIGRAFGRIDTMEQFERVMTTMTGSSEKANEVLDTTNDIVTGTAYGLDVAASAVQGFVTSNMGVDKATDSIAAWGDAVAFYGDGSNESFASVSTALSQMYAKGKVQMDTMNRLTEAGIPAMQIYADATGQSVEEVADQMSKGKLDADSFMNVMNDALKNGTENFAGIEGAAKEAGASWGGSFDNMRAAIARGVTSIIQGIDEMLVRNGLPDMRQMVSDFGKAFEDALKWVAGNIPPVVDAIKQMYNNLKPWLPILGSIALAVGAVFTAYSTWVSIKKIIDAVKKSQLALNVVAMFNPWGLIAMAVIAAAALIYIYWEPISAFFQDLWNKIKLYSMVAWEAIKSVWSAAVDWFIGAWESVKSFFSGLWDWYKEAFNSVVTFWTNLITGFIDWYKSAWNAVIDFWKGVWDTIVSIVMAIVEPLVAIAVAIYNAFIEFISPLLEFFSATWTNIVETAKTIWESFSEWMSAFWETVKTIAVNAWEILKNAVLGVILLFLDLVTLDFESFSSHLSQIWNNIKQAAMNIWNAIKDFFVATGQFISSTIRAVWGSIRQFLVDLWNYIKATATNTWNAITTAISAAINLAKSIIQSVWNAIRTFFTVTLVAIWNNIQQKFNDMRSSIQTGVNNARSTIQTVWNAIKSFFTTTLANIWNTVKQKFDDIKNAIRERMNDAKNTIQNIWNTAQRFLANVNLFSIGKDIISGLIRGIGIMAKKVWDKVTEITDGIKEKITGALGIFSPSRWMRDEVGVMLMRGFGIGIDKEKSATIGKMEEAAEWMKPELPEVSAIMNDIKGIARTLNPSIPVHHTGGLSASSSNAGMNSVYSPNITNYFTPSESTPAESARQQKKQQKRLAMEMGFS
ncbi:tape measure protein [Shouchella hunanensis]|uniref:Tape measure protein n=1 Tax=Shouchella hunanensis TaxID=766894 RepID=A0ABY7W323_9BACI|nr:tape measure protein [Shouchella hunanensis]WDF02961.1 tape measure protein [Shouchella hunanensis]